MPCSIPHLGCMCMNASEHTLGFGLLLLLHPSVAPDQVPTLTLMNLLLLSRASMLAGQNMKPEDVAELQRVAEDVSLLADRRAAFVSLFLDREAQ